MDPNKLTVKQLKEEIINLGGKLVYILGSGSKGAIIKKDLVREFLKLQKSTRKEKVKEKPKEIKLSPKEKIEEIKLSPKEKRDSSLLSKQPTDILFKIADELDIEEVFKFCETNSSFKKRICDNDNFWAMRLKKDFNVTDKTLNTFHREYIKLYQYKKNPELQDIIEEWLKDTTQELHLSNLKFWPEGLKGKEDKIVNLRTSWYVPLPDVLINCERFHCEYGKFNSLPALPKCKKLYCAHGMLNSELPLLPECNELDCSDNALIRLTYLPKCKILDCAGNRLTELPLLPKCKILNCASNRLTELPLLPKCKDLQCGWNILKTLPLLPKCKKLRCVKNQITDLPPLDKCEVLDCSNNKLTSLPKLPAIKYKTNLKARGNPFPPGYLEGIINEIAQRRTAGRNPYMIF